jgi:hypothetical protein
MNGIVSCARLGFKGHPTSSLPSSTPLTPPLKHHRAKEEEEENDFEQSGGDVKKDVWPNRVLLAVKMAQLMHDNWMPCNWSDMHLPGDGWRLSRHRVLVPTVPPHDSERTVEIHRRRKYLPADLQADPSYAADFDRWLTWRQIETDPRTKAGFLGDQDYMFVPPLPLVRPDVPRSRRQLSPPTPPQDDDVLTYYNDEAKDDK